MTFRAATVGLGVCTIAVALLNCGGGVSGTTSLRELTAIYEHCRTPVDEDSYEKVVRRSDDVRCGEAAQLAVAMSHTVGAFQVFETAAGITWTCSKLPRSSSPLVVRCKQGARSFLVERVPAP